MKGKLLKGKKKKTVEYFYYPVLRFTPERHNVRHESWWWRAGWMERTLMIFQDALCLV